MMKVESSFLFVLILFYFFLNEGYGQDKTTVDTTKQYVEVKADTAVYNPKHSPRRATLYSMVLPGLGQAYNKKYWKIPIVYAGFGVLYYFIKTNNNEYQKYKDAYYHSQLNVNGDLPPINDYEAKYEPDFLLSAKNYYRRNRDLTYILTGLWYVINVVDATVDAHLFTWEVNDDLSLRMEPDFVAPYASKFKPAGGLKLTLSF